MSDKYAALRAAKPYRADGGDIGSGRIKEIADNVYGDEEKIWLARRVLALLAEREADKARIAELEKQANINDRLCDSNYLAGMKAGWNLGIAEDNEGFNQCVRLRTPAGITLETGEQQ